MPFPRRLLIESEELVLEIRPHWIALVLPAIGTLLILVGLGFAIGYAPDDGTGRSAVVWGATAIAVFLIIWYPVRRFISWATS